MLASNAREQFHAGSMQQRGKKQLRVERLAGPRSWALERLGATTTCLLCVWLRARDTWMLLSHLLAGFFLLV